MPSALQRAILVPGVFSKGKGGVYVKSVTRGVFTYVMAPLRNLLQEPKYLSEGRFMRCIPVHRRKGF